jgi:hypothetical protein
MLVKVFVQFLKIYLLSEYESVKSSNCPMILLKACYVHQPLTYIFGKGGGVSKDRRVLHNQTYIIHMGIWPYDKFVHHLIYCTYILAFSQWQLIQQTLDLKEAPYKMCIQVTEVLRISKSEINVLR